MVEKKRSQYKPGNLLDFPEHIMDRKKYGYRWKSRERYAKNSDGYDPDGWTPFKTTDGQNIIRGDLILCQVPIDQFEEMLAYDKQEKEDQIKIFFETQQDSDDRESHEFRKKGGKVKFNYTQD